MGANTRFKELVRIALLLLLVPTQLILRITIYSKWKLYKFKFTASVPYIFFYLDFIWHKIIIYPNLKAKSVNVIIFMRHYIGASTVFLENKQCIFPCVLMSSFLHKCDVCFLSHQELLSCLIPICTIKCHMHFTFGLQPFVSFLNFQAIRCVCLVDKGRPGSTRICGVWLQRVTKTTGANREHAGIWRSKTYYSEDAFECTVNEMLRDVIKETRAVSPYTEAQESNGRVIIFPI